MAKKRQRRSKLVASRMPVVLPPGVKLLRTLEGHTETVFSVTLDPRGRLLASGSEDRTVRLWDVAGGKLLRTLEGHTKNVYSVAFNPRGGMLASGGSDETVRLWDVGNGQLLQTLEGHKPLVSRVAFDPQGEVLASVGADDTVRLWDAASGQLLRTIEAHTGIVRSVVFGPRGEVLASGGTDHTMRLWDAASGRLLRTLEGHTSSVLDVAFDVRGRLLASGGADNTVRIWEAASGKLLRTLEGHTSGGVSAVAFSQTAGLLASKSYDGTVRLWSCESWECVAVIPVPAQRYPTLAALCFHPEQPLLITDSSPSGSIPDKQKSCLISFWELDYDVLLGRGANTQTVHSTTAKVVLVGDSGVGKTGLGWRLAHGDYREHDSTHGQQFWVVTQLAQTRNDGTQCEAVLWDLAGQPDYRLIHALSVQDADLALILFDPTNSRDPLGSAEYWLRQLPPECPKILIAARVDRGQPVLTKEELDEFCRQHRIIAGWVATSASSGMGLDVLVERMKRAIPWDDKPAISTDFVFKSVKDFVLTLKENRTRKQIIFTPTELRQALVDTAKDFLDSLTDDKLLTAIRHLSSHGFVRLVTLSSGEERILLVPELLNNLASSIVLQARGNPRGLGAVEEGRLLDNSYRFRELEELSKPDQALLLDGAITAFLANRLSYRCFREAWGEIKLLVFPDLMNLKKPERDHVTEDGPSYILTGPTENTFAALVVFLGYTNFFQRTDQAQDVAWFESHHADICGVRRARDDEHSLVLLFGPTAGERVRNVFEGLVEDMLSRRETGVRRQRSVKCPKCGTLVDRAVMARRIKLGKADVGCEECPQRVPLPADEPLSLRATERARITHEGAVADLRTRFEEVIFELKRLAEAEKWRAPLCFVSYAWGNADHERWVERRMALDLEKAGITVILDRWDNAHPGASVPRFLDRIEKADRVLVVGSLSYRRKHENKDSGTGTVVAAEMDRIEARLMGPEAKKATVIPLLLEGEPNEALPPALHTRVRSDFRDDNHYFDTALTLLLGLYGVEPRHPAVTHWKDKLAGGDPRRAFAGSAD